MDEKEAAQVITQAADMGYIYFDTAECYTGNRVDGSIAFNEDLAGEAAQNKAKRTAVHLIKLGKMTLEEIAEATELSIDIVKELESQSMQLA